MAAFIGNEYIKNVYIGKKIKRINNGVFSGNSKLKNVRVGKKTKIKKYAFTLKNKIRFKKV